MKNTDTEDLTGKVIKAAYTVHNILGPGFQEIVYRNALAIELQEMGIEAVKVFQIKAVSHEVQLVNYLTATKIEHGLLINFGSSVKVKHKFKTYKKTK
jgi:hypothetical protein